MDLDTSGFTKGFNRATQDLKTFTYKNATANDKLAATGSALRNVGSTLTKTVTLPLVGIGTAAMKVGNEFEAQMSRVQAIAGASGDELEALTQQALDLGSATAFSASEAALGMEQLASAGFTTEEIMQSMPGLLDLAASSGADLATASEIAASALRGFGLDASEAGHVADVFAEAAARTNAQTEDMGEAMKYVAPVAHAMGQSLEETAAAIGIMSDAGIKGSQAGTTLRGALTRLTKPTKAMTTVMDEYGLSFFDANGNMLSMTGIVEQLETNLGDLTQEQRNSALATLFGQESLSGMLALMERGSDTLAEMTESFQEVDGAAAEMADTMMDNTSGAIEEFGGAIETAMINLQQVLAPVVKEVVQWLTELVNKFNNLDEGAQKGIVTFLGIAAAIGPVLLILGKLVTAVSSIKKGFTALSTAFKAVKVVIAALGAPFGTIIAVIAAVAAAAVALKLAWDNNFGGIQEKTAEIGASLKQMFDNFISMLQSWGQFFLGLWESDWMGIQSTVTGIMSVIERLFSAALDVLNEIVQLFGNIFAGNWSEVWNNVVNIITIVLNNLLGLFGTDLDTLISTLAGIGESLWSTAKEVFNQLWDGFKGVWADVVAWFELAKTDPKSAFTSVLSDMYDTGKNILNNLWDGLKEAWESVTAWLDGIAQSIKGILSVSADVTVNTHSNGRSGSFASGLDYVPRDMLVKVHEGESIRTKQQTKEDSSRSSGGDTFNFYSPQPIDELEAAKQMKRAKRDLAEGF